MHVVEIINAVGMDETYGTYVDDECFDIHDYDDDTDHDTDGDTDDDTDVDTNDDTDIGTDDGTVMLSSVMLSPLGLPWHERSVSGHEASSPEHTKYND